MHRSLVLRDPRRRRWLAVALAVLASVTTLVTSASPASATPVWPVTYGATGVDIGSGYHLETDSAGNLYSVVHVADGSITIGGSALEGDGSAYTEAIVSHDDEGNLRWVYALPSQFTFGQVATTPSGHTYAIVLDQALGSTGFEGETLSSGDALVLALDEDGLLAWTWLGAVGGGRLAAGPDDSVFVTTSGPTYDTAVLKRLDSGDVVWSETLDGWANGIAVSGDSVIANLNYLGEYGGACRLSLAADGSNWEAAVISFDVADGYVNWAQAYGAADADDVSGDIVGDGQGGAYVLHSASSYPSPRPTTHFGSVTLDTNPGVDLSLAYIDETGEFQWAIDSPGNDVYQGAGTGGDLLIAAYVHSGTPRTFGVTTVDPTPANANVVLAIDSAGTISVQSEVDITGDVGSSAPPSATHYAIQVWGSGGTIDGQPVSPTGLSDLVIGTLP